MPDVFKRSVKKTTTHTNQGGSSTMGSFMIRPQGIHFETQQDQEVILLFMRQHPITNVGWIVTAVIMILFPVLGLPFFFSLGVELPQFPPGYFFILPLLWYLGTFGFIFTNFLHWYYNVYIVTSDRVVDIDWVSLLYKRFSSTQLSKIQDVTYKQGGLLDSFFDYGTVLIQTAGTDPNFEFVAVPKPDQVVHEINRIIEHDEKQ